jgi:hypothetical protein
MWRDNDVHGSHGEAVKRIRHPVLGPLAFEYSAFAVDGRTDLSMVVYNPATPADAEKIGSRIGSMPDASRHDHWSERSVSMTAANAGSCRRAFSRRSLDQPCLEM